MLRVHTSNLFHPLSQFLALLRKKVGENAPPAKKTLAAAAAASPSAQEQHSTLFGSNLPDATTSSSVSTQKTRKVALSALPGAMAPPPPRSRQPPPPPPSPALPPPDPPATTKALPGIEHVNSDDEEEGEAVQAITPSLPVPPAALPAGFFDEGVDDAENTAVRRGNVEENDGDGEAGSLPSSPKPEKSSASTSALPTGFFDDPEADALAHNIDLNAEKEAEARKEWEDFQKFAADVAVAEAGQEVVEEEEWEEEERRKELEHLYYTARLAGLMATSGEATERRRKKRGKDGEGEGEEEGMKKGEAVSNSGALPGVPSEAEAPTWRAVPEDEDGDGKERVGDEGREKETVAALEISAMLREKKRRKKEAMQEVVQDGYVAPDPLDWRAKSFA